MSPTDIPALAAAVETALSTFNASGIMRTDAQAAFDAMLVAFGDWLDARRAALAAGMVECWLSPATMTRLRAFQNDPHIGRLYCEEVADALAGDLDPQQLVSDPAHVIVILSRETVDGLRASARAGVPFGGEPLTRDLAAVLKEGA
jgi:hypothetical protein